MKRSMHWANFSLRIVAMATVAMAPAVGLAQDAVTVEFPDPALYFQNSSFAVDGDVGYSPTFDNDADNIFLISNLFGDCADLDGDGAVGIVDLLELLAQWGSCPGCPADLDGDDRVDITDFLAMLATWGPCP